MLVDWIQGVGTMLVTLVIGALTIQQAWTAEQNRQQDMKIARSAEHNKILSAYIQQMMQEPLAAQLKANQVPDAARLRLNC